MFNGSDSHWNLESLYLPTDSIRPGRPVDFRPGRRKLFHYRAVSFIGHCDLGGEVVIYFTISEDES